MRGLGDTYQHEFLNVPSYASSISRLQPHLQRVFPPHPSDSVTFQTHNGRGPNWASFKRLYRKRPGRTLFTFTSEFCRRVAPDTALAYYSTSV
jgi:hypothetical protein